MVEAIVEARLTEMTQGAVARALAGDTAATRLLLKPYLPRRPVAEFELGEIETASDVRDASAAVLRAATEGVLDAKEAFALHRLVEARARLLGYVPPDAPPPLLQLQFEPRQPGEPHMPKLTPEDVQEALDPEFPSCAARRCAPRWRRSPTRGRLPKRRPLPIRRRPMSCRPDGALCSTRRAPCGCARSGPG